MKDFFISGDDIKICRAPNECSLPTIIRREQYANKDITTKSSDNGYIGNGYYDFDLNIKDDPNANDSEDKHSFAIIKKIFESSNIGFIKKDRLFDSELGISILEIADYGSQSMSPFFRDFVPHIFINGKKIWQKYISTIRHYSKRKMYILIKNVNNLGSIDFSDSENEITNNDIVIRICFKNLTNISYSDAKDTSSTVKLSDTSTSFNSFSFTTTSLLGTMGSFESPDYNSFFGNYLIEVNEEFLSPLAIKEIKFTKIENRENREKNTKDIAKQANYFNQISTTLNSNTDYSRDNATVNIDITLKEEIKIDNKTSLIVNIIPKTIFKEAIYSDELKNNETLNEAISDAFSKESLNPVNINIFGEDGCFKIFDENLTENIEIIPEYETTRKILIDAKSDISIQSIFNRVHTKHPTLFSWNSITNKYFGYTDAGTLFGEIKKDEIKKDEDDANTEDNKIRYLLRYLLIYDNVLKPEYNEAGLNNDSDFISISEPDETDIDIKFSTDNVLLSNSHINSIFVYNLNNLIKINKKENYTKVFFNCEDPDGKLGNILSFYAESKGNAAKLEKLNFIAIIRSFPIKYEKTMIDNNTVLFKLPDYFIFNNILNKNEINPKINRNFLTGLERFLCAYIEENAENSEENEENGKIKINLSDIKFYNVHKANEDISNKNFYDTTRLVNINCINYINRNILT